MHPKARTILWLALAASAVLPACAVPPRANDPSLHPAGVRADFFTPPTVRVHIYSINDAAIPAEALRRSVVTVERHLGRPIEIIDHGARTIAVDDQGELAQPAGVPFEDGAGRPLTRPLGGQTLNLETPDRGVVGCVGIDVSDGGLLIRPVVDPGVIVVLCLPGPPDGVGVTGYATQIPISPDDALRTGMVVLNQSVIDAHSNLFVGYDKLYEWTLTHEIGHVLGIPADASHAWLTPGRGPHCTHPECVMYTGVDWRVVVSGLLHGWPLDYCEVCSTELKTARLANEGPTR